MKIDYDNARRIASQIGREGGNVCLSAGSVIKKTMETRPQIWTGVDAELFDEVIKKWRKENEAIRESLLDLAQEIGNTADELEEAERESAARIAAKTAANAAAAGAGVMSQVSKKGTAAKKPSSTSSKKPSISSKTAGVAGGSAIAAAKNTTAVKKASDLAGKASSEAQKEAEAKKLAEKVLDDLKWILK